MGTRTIRRVSTTGVVNTSSGDSLVAHFRPVTAGAGGVSLSGKGSPQKSEGQGTDEISDATEQGHVVMTQLSSEEAG